MTFWDVVLVLRGVYDSFKTQLVFYNEASAAF